MINNDTKKIIDKSVLCWLATSNKHNEPNVSPKEIFTYQDAQTLLIANVASPNSIENIKDNPNICVSFVDIFVQKGCKIKGVASLINKGNDGFISKLKLLTDLFSDKFPINTIIEVNVKSVVTIQAPSYFLFSETTEQSQIESALKTYKIKLAE